MANIGLRYIAASKIEKEEYGKAPTYGTGFIIGKGIQADITINANDNPLYADNAIAENDRSFSDGTIKFGVDDIALKIQADILGATYTPTTGETPESLIKASGDVAPYLGTGFVKTNIKNNVKKYIVTLLYKVQFAPFSENAKTKEKSIEWQTPEIEGSIMIVEGYKNDAYEEIAAFDTEEKAIAWLNTKLNITGSEV